MKKSLSCRRSFLFLTIFYFFLPYSVNAAVHVFMGFMDEEVSPVLKTLIQNAGQDIYVVERGQKTKDSPLFELPLSDYYGNAKYKDPKIINISGINKNKDLIDHQSTNLLEEIASKVQTSLNINMQKIISKRIGEKSKINKDFNFSILKFESAHITSGHSPKDIIVVVRSPEMGLQPDMMEPSLKAVLEPIVKSESGQLALAASKEQGGTYLHCFGTSGAVSGDENSGPGTSKPIKHALYVGLEQAGDGKFHGSVKLVYGDKKTKDKEFYPGRTKNPTILSKAVEGVRNFWEADISLEEKTAIADDIKKIIERDNIGLTVSFFAAEKDKKTGRDLGLATVNMEDSHVFKVIKELDFTGFKIVRLNCDPATIPHNITPAITDWAKDPTHKYHSQAYIDAIMWGLLGKKNTDLTSEMHWNAFDKSRGLKPGDLENYITPISAAGRSDFILDPFLLEIGTDLISDAKLEFNSKDRNQAGPGNFFASDIVNKAGETIKTHFGLFRKPLQTLLLDLDQINPDSILNQLMAIKAGRVRKIAARIDQLGQIKPFRRSMIQAEILNLLNEAGSIDFSDLSLQQFKSDAKLFNLKKDLPENFEVQVKTLEKKLVAKLSQLSEKDKRSSGMHFDEKGALTIDLLLANGSMPYSDLKAPLSFYEGWIREGKWDNNQERTIEQLVQRPCNTGQEPNFAPECIDRMSFKHGLMFFTKGAGEEFTNLRLNFINRLREVYGPLPDSLRAKNPTGSCSTLDNLNTTKETKKISDGIADIDKIKNHLNTPVEGDH